MENRSDGGGALVAICLVLILLLLIGGAGMGFFLVARRQTALAMEARLAEAEARMQAERARSEAQAAADLRLATDKAPPPDATDSVRAAVESVLRAQEEAWNRGDIDAFVEQYWKSDGLTFSSGGKLTRGWAETLNRYKERYPTAEKMGHLGLGELEITVLSDSAALVLGEWKVERDNEPLSGNFSLVVRKFDDRWLIVHDHTSQIAH